MVTQQPSNKSRKKGPKLTKDGKITVFDAEDTSYGIRELIDLIRFIPDGQDVFFGAEMIKKTLASMQLSIHDIMQDGVEKRKLAAKTIQHLVAEISDYQRRIQSLKSHIRHLRFELGEIQDTCHYLLSEDSELSQYQHILDEVPKSPIEGAENEDDDDDEIVDESGTPLQAAGSESNESQTVSSDESPERAEVNTERFEANETLVDRSVPTDDFLPDAFKNPDEEYQGTQDADTLTEEVLTDDVFDPDRFDDENGVQNTPVPPTLKELAEEDEPDEIVDLAEYTESETSHTRELAVEDEEDTNPNTDSDTDTDPDDDIDMTRRL